MQVIIRGAGNPVGAEFIDEHRILTNVAHAAEESSKTLNTREVDNDIRVVSGQLI